jgi:glycosyltransferase involved in cell wall biosynthesis
MVTKEFPPISGGLGFYVHNLSKKLLQRGHHVTVITRGTTRTTKKQNIDGIRVFRVSFFPLYPLHIWIHGIFVNSLLKSLESKLTLVHLHTPLTPPLKTSLPIITTVHTPLKIDTRHYEISDFYSLAIKVQSMAIYPPIESKLFQASKKITTVSSSVANELAEYGLNPKKIAVIGNGVDEKTFVPIQNDKKKENYILYTGIFRPRKGLFDLINCAEHVIKEYPEIKFILTGRGILREKLKKEIQLRGLQKNITFLGYVSRKKLVETYQNATVHVIPSHYEGLPTVLLEAMSCGLPVVATDIGGNNEVISTGVNGFLVPPKCPEIMARSILKLLYNPSLREQIGQAARKTIEEHYTWNQVTDNILKHYKEILGTKKQNNTQGYNEVIAVAL